MPRAKSAAATAVKDKKADRNVVSKRTPASKKGGQGANGKAASNGTTRNGERGGATGNSGLSGNKIKVLQALAGAPNGMTRNELSEVTGIVKGWAKLLGAPTVEGGGSAGDTSMEAQGLVKSHKPADSRSMVYTITSLGRNKLNKAKG